MAYVCDLGDVVPEGYSLKKMAFVEKLVINDDPEYQWIDKIRTPRASNEARQTLFMKLSSTVQRKIGLMALVNTLKKRKKKELFFIDFFFTFGIFVS